MEVYDSTVGNVKISENNIYYISQKRTWALYQLGGGGWVGRGEVCYIMYQANNAMPKLHSVTNNGEIYFCGTTLASLGYQ